LSITLSTTVTLLNKKTIVAQLKQKAGHQQKKKTVKQKSSETSLAALR
jgi:hypothetical protein